MKIAIVGTGGVARRHLGVLRDLPDVEIVGHVSHDVARADEQARDWGGRGYTAVADLLDDARPRAVWICVTPDRHGPLEQALIERGVPFFVEKPLAVDLGTAEDIANRVEAAALITGVGYKFRALDTLEHVRALLAERPPRMVLVLWHDRIPPPAWWHRESRGGGQIVEQATHLLDLARVLVGPAEVLAGLGGRWPRADVGDVDVPDVSTALLRFSTLDGSVPGVVSTTSLLAGHGPIELQLICEGRVLRLSERELVVDSGSTTERIASRVDTYVVENQAFLTAVRTGDPTTVTCSYADALQSHRLACQVRDALHVAAGRA